MSNLEFTEYEAEKLSGWLNWIKQHIDSIEARLFVLETIEYKSVYELAFKTSLKTTTDDYKTKIYKLLKLKLSAGTEAFLCGVNNYIDTEGCISPKQAAVVDRIVGEYSK